ncbi:hypothetical protein [Amycolatopsis palatopharyngis]|uniref:hypothetical protein n=1 Tax=Amycolatopsis palatopharyngis TaxID=187982 RepID=UPI000E261DD8|nr:hypothetical protein [Amycolatopsis palatopharyngis]
MSNLKSETLGPGTLLRNKMDVELKVVGMMPTGDCIGQIFKVKHHGGPWGPTLYATREGLEQAGYEVVSDD